MPKVKFSLLSAITNRWCKQTVRFYFQSLSNFTKWSRSEATPQGVVNEIVSDRFRCAGSIGWVLLHLHWDIKVLGDIADWERVDCNKRTGEEREPRGSWELLSTADGGAGSYGAQHDMHILAAQ